MLLSQLARETAGTVAGGDAEVTGVAVDSRAVRPGDLFVAVRGRQTDGARFVADARARGATAVCGEAPSAGVPTLVVGDPRAVLGRISAAVYGHPARELALIGLTGTLGKTSTALLLEGALGAGDRGAAPVGVVGSLGVRVGGRRVDGGDGTAAMTTPDAPALHHAFRRMVGAGVRLAVMEVTSHALAQGRVAGLEFVLGVFTNLVPDEHLEFHDTPDDYVRTKLRFLDQLAPGAPLVIDYDDVLVRESTARLGERVASVSAEGDAGAGAVVEQLRADAGGSTFALRLTRALPGTAGRRVGPLTLPLVLPVFGETQAANAALAALAALLAGAEPAAVTAAVAEVRPIRRRMQVLRAERPFVLDDTSGNPRTLDGVFRSLRHVPHDALRVVFGIRGSRGAAINRGLAEALGRGARGASERHPVRLVITASEDAAGPRDQVRPEERDAVLATLRAAGVPHEFDPRLAGAVGRALDGCGARDAVLLLGAQGMDQAAELAMGALGGA